MDKVLVVGLGNPGIKYRNTRHNIGFMAADALISYYNVDMRGGFYSDYGDFVIDGKKVFIQKPQTYMNLSGKAVAALASYYDIELENILVIYDDVDLPFGKLKIKRGGSSAGHKGLISIISCVGSEDFIRAKMGIGRPENPNIAVSDYVLGKFSRAESKNIEEFVDLCKNAVSCFIKEGIVSAMTKFNNKNITKKED
ncbi:MAG: aminoacyl-tRNA hydrolase [Flexistipes sinusarabici]|uniref:Peptidyl-tRNA hydrolase n=1 Tax=Flexistipes sinusarabici TaxID=2352 RepID=A0A5D0MNW1_FLESI|nr:aminoacyl-tRNA hydrolase [Flexistipes sinusarabici]TYB34102.1 MAG: aminoacyl-tRNA hydrolase [Flexistipes sinusarabici]